MSALLSLLARLAGLIASIAIVLMMLHVTTEVVLRVGFRAPASGTIEIVSYFYMVAAVFLGIFVAAWQNAHIRVDVIANLFSRPLQRVTDLLAELITVVFFAFFAWGLARTALQKTHQHEAVDAVFAHLTVWPTRWVAVVGLVLALCAASWRLARMLAGADTRDAVSDFVVDDDEAVK
ncbi:TRAP transporter small permease [Salinisphaera aquimarina]|uniref:TRAP transporter small permease protein n=1 Tax=Salinisphaera aquimarina TaxID=2094031 RepID=A0ABV7EKU5_9GAMM